MPTPLSAKRTILAAKLEGTPGTSEKSSIGSADADFTVLDPVRTPEIERFDRGVVTDSDTRLAPITGRKLMRIQFRTELNHSNGASYAAEPNVPHTWHKLMKCCSMAVKDIATVTTDGSGPATGQANWGEIVTGGTSTETAVIIGDYSTSDLTSDATLLVHSASGAFSAGEALTTPASGGNMSTLAGAGTPYTANKGFAYVPDKSQAATLTLALYMDGTWTVIYGARGTWTYQGKAGQVAYLEFNFLGILDEIDDEPIVAPSYPTHLPPTIENAALEFDGYSAIVEDVTIAMNNNITNRPDYSSANGILESRTSDQDPTLTINPELTTIANYDWWNNMINSVTGRFKFELALDGSGNRVSGKTIGFFMPNVAIETVQDAERDNDRLLTVTAKPLRPSLSTANTDVVQVYALYQ